jgi:hypothetical protein
MADSGVVFPAGPFLYYGARRSLPWSVTVALSVFL